MSKQTSMRKGLHTGGTIVRRAARCWPPVFHQAKAPITIVDISGHWEGRLSLGDNEKRKSSDATDSGCRTMGDGRWAMNDGWGQVQVVARLTKQLNIDPNINAVTYTIVDQAS